MKSTKKKQKQLNQHTSYIIIFIYIDFQAGQKKKSPWYGLGSNHEPLVYKANFSHWLDT